MRKILSYSERNRRNGSLIQDGSLSLMGRVFLLPKVSVKLQKRDTDGNRSMNNVKNKTRGDRDFPKLRKWVEAWISQGGGNCRSEGAPGETGRGGTLYPAQCQGGARLRQAGKGWLHQAERQQWAYLTSLENKQAASTLGPTGCPLILGWTPCSKECNLI